MIEHSVEHYECVQKYPILKGYLEHFREVSKDNEIPGLLSFFFILGQAALPFVRIPIGASNIDPRVSVFWIQDTRTGKSVAFEIIQRIMRDAGLECVDYTTGTDAAMVGSFSRDEDGTLHQTPGILAGKKGLNFDEGSIILKPNQHSEGTVLFLQSALNSAGTGRNVLTKHLKDGTITIESLVSLWITTYPPQGIKEHVLDKGIFQRVLVYWRHWTLDMKRNIAHQLADSVHNQVDFEISYNEVVEFFTDLGTRLKQRVCELNGNPAGEWNDSTHELKEGWTMNSMYDMFTLDNSYRSALHQAIDDYYDLVENMDPKKQGVCASFIMGLQNYTNVLAHHMAIIEGVWVVTGDHVDMAKEILYDLYHNLIDWLESEVKVGMASATKSKLQESWKSAYWRCEQVDFNDNRGPGWIKKAELLTMFGKAENLTSKAGINNKYNESATGLFEDTREGKSKYVRLSKDHRKKGD